MTKIIGARFAAGMLITKVAGTEVDFDVKSHPSQG